MGSWVLEAESKVLIYTHKYLKYIGKQKLYLITRNTWIIMLRNHNNLYGDKKISIRSPSMNTKTRGH